MTLDFEGILHSNGVHDPDRMLLLNSSIDTGALIWFWVRDPKKVETVLCFLVRDPLNGTFLPD